jgi:hypothetical protein
MRSRLQLIGGVALLLFLLLPGTASAAPQRGSLMKLACPAGAGVNDPCRAVYFYGNDGKRHAFPHAKVYFTWYPDFSTVQVASASFLASVPLGSNVTPRPGLRLVKFQTDPKTYAVALGGTLRWVKDESAASALYGTSWNSMVDDVSDAFFQDYSFGADIGVSSDFDRAAETAAAATIDDDLPATRRSLTVTTSRGNFLVEMVKLQRLKFRMVTDTAEGKDCTDLCAAKGLADYVQSWGAVAAIHGSYFCPPDYPECVGKVNTFLSPFFDGDGQVMVNADSLAVHQGPMLAYASDGAHRFFHRTKDFGASVDAFQAAHGAVLQGAASNYPSLVEDGAVIVESEQRLDDGMKTIKGVRGGIGIDDRFVYLVIARASTVPDLAETMRTLGARHAFNLDGGGSAALWFDGAYAFGPGRLLPNAILFVRS